MKLTLPHCDKRDLTQVTLVCVDTLRPQAAVNSMNICRHAFDFAEMLLFTNSTDVVNAEGIEIIQIDELKNREDYGKFIMENMPHCIDTSHFLTCQWDGTIVHPYMWNDEWLQWDYLGSLSHEKIGKLTANGNGGFILRSKKIMWQFQKYRQDIRPTFDDTLMSMFHRQKLIEEGLKCADGYTVCGFGCACGRYEKYESFGWHDFRCGDPLGIEACQRANEVLENETDDKLPQWYRPGMEL